MGARSAVAPLVGAASRLVCDLVLMALAGWTRRLDDRVDALLRRRVGFGLTDPGPEPGSNRHLLMVLVVAGSLGLFLTLVLVASGQGGRWPIFLGPVVGALVGPLFVRLRRGGARRELPLLLPSPTSSTDRKTAPTTPASSRPARARRTPSGARRRRLSDACSAPWSPTARADQAGPAIHATRRRAPFQPLDARVPLLAVVPVEVATQRIPVVVAGEAPAAHVLGRADVVEPIVLVQAFGARRDAEAAGGADPALVHPSDGRSRHGGFRAPLGSAVTHR